MNTEWKEIDDLKERWDRLQPLSPDNHARLWKKMRLDWNYNSNHIEGNALTYAETELLLLHSAASGNHQLRDYEEMKAHDVAIGYVKALAEDRTRLLGESDIRNLNRITLREGFWKDGPSCQPTRKQANPGEYRSSANNVRNGEVFHFASPEETPARMQELVVWIRSELESLKTPIPELLARFHHDLISIQPFDDGNGRITRLLLNYILLRLGYPPLIIKSEDKANYFAALRKADTGDLNALAVYLAAQLEQSLQLGIRAGNGGSVEELSDVDKELAIFIRDQKSSKRVTLRSPEILTAMYEKSWRDLFEKFEQKIAQLYPLFADHLVQAQGGEIDWHRGFPDACRRNTEELRLNFELRGYTGNSLTEFNLSTFLSIAFKESYYTITAGYRSTLTRSYAEPVLSGEADAIATGALKALFDKIKGRAQQV